MEKKFYYMMSILSSYLFLSLCISPFLYAHEEHKLDERKPVCLKEYPTDPVQFNANVSLYVKQIIDKHG